MPEILVKFEDRVIERVVTEKKSITIGKFTLIYHRDASREGQGDNFEGTMVLHTKKQKELIEKDKREKEIISKAGTSVLMGEDQTDVHPYRISRPGVALGKAEFANIKVKGFWVSSLQAKIVEEDTSHVLVNVGKKGKTKVNGEDVDRCVVKNDDLIQVGKSVFRSLEGKK